MPSSSPVAAYPRRDRFRPPATQDMIGVHQRMSQPRRASFESDFQRALSGATGDLASDLHKEKSVTLKTITNGKFDMSARTTHVALEQRLDSGNQHGYLVLVTLNGYRSSAPDVPTPSQLALTVLDVNGKWLVSNIDSVGVN